MKNNREKKTNPTLASIKYFFPDAWKKKKGYFVLSVINVLFSAVIPFVDILILPLIINALIAPDKDVSLIINYAIMLVSLDFFFQVMNSFLTVQLEKYADYFMNETSIDISRRCMELDFALTENKQALDQIKKARDGISWSGCVHEISKAFFGIITQAIRILGVSTIMLINAPWLLVILIVVLIISTIINNKKNKIDIKQFSELSNINRIFGHIAFEMESFQYGKDIRLYGAAGMIVEKATQQIKRMDDYWENINKQKFPLNMIDVVVSGIRSFGTYLYLGTLAILGKITIGTFSQLVTSTGVLSMSLQGIIFSIQDIIKRSNYAYEIVKFMEYPAYMEKGNKAIENLNEGHTIEFRNVSFAYPNTDVKVLENVSITLKSGERLSVVGLNGAGKTTFVKLLCRLYDTDDGEILLDGVNIRSYDYDEYMKLFSVVFQDFKLLAFTTSENVLLGNSEEDFVTDDLFEKVGILEKVKSLPKGKETMMFKMFDKEGVELSGGEQQKLAIARALYKNAPVIILDEPTAALDPVAEYEIYRRFNELVGGKTAIYISHRLSSCKFCDKIAVFSEGTVKEYGTHSELLRKEDGIYSEMFKAQAQYYI